MAKKLPIIPAAAINELQKFVQTYSLASTLYALAHIADDNGEDVMERWGDHRLAAEWFKAAAFTADAANHVTRKTMR